MRKVQAFEFLFWKFLFSDQKLTYTLANISVYVNDFMQFYVVNIITIIYCRRFIYNKSIHNFVVILCVTDSTHLLTIVWMCLYTPSVAILPYFYF